MPNTPVTPPPVDDETPPVTPDVVVDAVVPDDVVAPPAFVAATPVPEAGYLVNSDIDYTDENGDDVHVTAGTVVDYLPPAAVAAFFVSGAVSLVPPADPAPKVDEPLTPVVVDDNSADDSTPSTPEAV
jgi:hypothetical protein